MLFHVQKSLALTQRRADLASKARSWNIRALHSSQRCREQYLDASQKTFNEVALNEHASDRVVLVDFYADWCGPCKMISPILEKLSEDPNIKTGSGRSLDLVTVDTDKEFELAQKYRVRSLPTVMAFKGGKPVNHFIGALSEGDVRKFLQQL
ncbi:putative thioredoxin [Butyriboletus roseoflavus]|nr:putative thioredoxin [Butyriboletus roseoflavus]